MTQDANTELDEQLETEEVQQEVETSEADSSTDSGDNHEEKSNGVQARIDQITREKWEERRKREELEAKLAEFEKGTTSQPEAKSHEAPTAPSLPDDIYDEDAMKKYHQDMISFTESVSRTQAQKYWESQQAEQQKTQQSQQQQEVIKRYADNAQKAGVDLGKLQDAERLLVERKIHNDLANRLLNDPNGPQVITYLADNPAELDLILGTDPISAAVKIETEIKAKALSKTPRVTSAPEPIPDIGGGGAIETDEFEKLYGKAEFI